MTTSPLKTKMMKTVNPQFFPALTLQSGGIETEDLWLICNAEALCWNQLSGWNMGRVKCLKMVTLLLIPHLMNLKKRIGDPRGRNNY